MKMCVRTLKRPSLVVKNEKSEKLCNNAQKNKFRAAGDKIDFPKINKKNVEAEIIAV